MASNVDYGITQHCLDGNGQVITTTVYDQNRVFSLDTINVTIPLEMAIQNVEQGRDLIQKVRSLSTRGVEGHGKVFRFDISVSFPSNDRFHLEENDIRGEPGDDKLDIEWKYDIPSGMVSIMRNTAFNIVYSAYHSHILLVKLYLDYCKSIKETR